MRLYFTHDGNIEKGPYTKEQLIFESLTKETLIWYEGLENWIPADEVEDLNDLFIKTTPPPISKRKNSQASPPKYNLVPANSDAVTEGSDPVTRKNKKFIFYISLAAALLCGIGGWSMYQHSQNKNTIVNLEDRIGAQEQETDKQRKEAIAKENERQRVNAAITKKNMNYRNNWQDYISVDRSSYSYSSLGGIDPFEISVTNQTDYKLDEVVVNINYIKANGEIYKIEPVSISNISPHSSKSEIAPRSSRGTSVTTEIASISSNKMHFCYPFNNGNPNDPYFCK